MPDQLRMFPERKPSMFTEYAGGRCHALIYEGVTTGEYRLDVWNPPARLQGLLAGQGFTQTSNPALWRQWCPHLTLCFLAALLRHNGVRVPDPPAVSERPKTPAAVNKYLILHEEKT